MKFISFLFGSLLLVSCSQERKKLFTIHSGASIGIDFKNSITETERFNAQTFEYIYNGSGVGIGDFNNDGLEDVFFGGNQVSSELYLNQGGLKFKKVTALAGIATSRWITGVSVVDINQDGLLDIYLSVAGKVNNEDRRNLLFINDGVTVGVPHFTEMAKSYGLADDSYSTMAAFFDYDKDGDLDMYLLNNWLEKFNRNNIHAKRINGEAESTDRLYRNNGDHSFSNISREAGILIEGYGLGVEVCDINGDSWPDLYVANDFLSNDLIWVNQKNGTFKNRAAEYLKHQSHNAMGVDIADFNNDGLPDICVADMLPPDNMRQKLMAAGQNFDYFDRSLAMGFQPQYVRNTLQLNRGTDSAGTTRFSEMAFMAGVAKTDWSWAPLFADFDNDGLKDLFIGNGYRRDVTNLDFVFFDMNKDLMVEADSLRRKKYFQKLKLLPEVKTSNYIFRNKGDLSFEDKTSEWGLTFPDYSNGAAYCDFDRDGDLDLITNNLDQEAMLFENLLNERDTKAHFINFRCKDSGSLNQKIQIYARGLEQLIESTPYRGFQSTVSSVAHFGIGSSTKVDSVIITLPNQSMIRYQNLRADSTYYFSIREATPFFNPKSKEPSLTFKKEVLMGYFHRETSPTDFKITRTLLHELTEYGPCVAVGDVNSDGRDDFFIGAEKGSPSRLFIQLKNGTFQAKNFSKGLDREDGGALFFDMDNDGDLDLYVASACATSLEEAKPHQLFTNDGTGQFTLSNGLPEINTSAACVESADFDGDGDLDLFVGGRIKPKEYPFPPRSYILKNERGKFIDITKELNPDLQSPGLVSSAIWADFNNDRRPDLILAGEWMPIRVFKNDKDHFTEVTKILGLDKTNGWWNCLKAADLNNDGYIDIVAGNTGKNSFFQPSLTEPVQIIASDFDKNGSVDPMVTYFNTVEHDRFLVHNRLVTLDQIPMLKKRFKTFAQYAATPFQKIFSPDEMKDAFTLSVYTLASALLINHAGTNIEMKELPPVAQLSTINDVWIEDINGDTFPDLLLIGNNYSQETQFGRYDASIGSILLNDGNFNWRELNEVGSNFIVDYDARHIRKLRSEQKVRYMVVGNQNPIYFYDK